MATDPFNPTDSAAMVKPSPKTQVRKSPPIDPTQLSALPPLLKDRPIILPPKKATPKATMEMGEYKFPDNNDPYWKAHPLQTVHGSGQIRAWGEDTTAMKNPNTLPKQMLPPPSNPQGNQGQKAPSDKAKGQSNTYYPSRDQPKSKAIDVVHSNYQ